MSVCAAKFVISFARRQHQFDIAAPLNDADSNILLLCPCSNFAQNVIILICSYRSDHLRWISPKYLQ